MRKLKNLKKHKSNLKDFYLTNPTVKRVRNFLNTKIFYYLKKIILLLLVAIIIIFFALKFFSPQYLEKIYSHSSNYFFHLFNLDSRDFRTIRITGNERVTNEEIIAVINSVKNNFKENHSGESSQNFIKILPAEIKNQLHWINKVNITRTLPNRLNIEIKEYKPFAILQHNNKQFIVDKDGNIIKIDDIENEEFKHLIILSGKNANLHVKSLFNILAINPELSSHVYSATWIGSRRWDIRFENGLLIKLPTTRIDEAWQELIKLYNMPKSLNSLNVIDLRINAKVYLEYDDSHIKEIKNLKL